ncbi:WGR domain-containing protein [Micromonospora chersina]|uniref:WGR domain-containing protein n=1 Tax=Micromonospora chersina TaxID=47854 RepID=UPI003713B897
MERPTRSAHFERVAPDQNQFKWYTIDYWAAGDDLFGTPRIEIRHGRMGQAGDSKERYFNSTEEANEYFDRKVNERIVRGYRLVGQASVGLNVPDCALCGLVRVPSKHPTFICEFRRSVFFISWDQTYPGRSMLVFKTHLPDFFHMSPSELLSILPEVRQAEVALRKAFDSSMMNYLFMGNTAHHVHLHLVPRSERDPNFGSSPFLDTSRVRGPQLPSDEYRRLARSVAQLIEPRPQGR